MVPSATMADSVRDMVRSPASMITSASLETSKDLPYSGLSMTSSKPPRTLPEAGRVARNTAAELGPYGRPLCRWCRMEILAARRRSFCSAYCVHQWRLRSDPGYLRDQVLLRDRGVCALCATDTLAAFRSLQRSRGARREEALAMWGLSSMGTRRSLWDADHITAVAEGGGQCALENLRTLCLPCHREVTADLHRRLRAEGSPSRALTGVKGRPELD